MTFKKNETSPRNNFLPATQKPFPSLILSVDDIIHTWVPSLFFFSFFFFLFFFAVSVLSTVGVGGSNLALITPTDALRVDGRVLIVVRAEAECCGNMWECVCFKIRLLLSVRSGASGGGGAWQWRPWHWPLASVGGQRGHTSPPRSPRPCFTPAVLRQVGVLASQH